MLEAIAGVLLMAAPAKDAVREAYAHAKELTPPPACSECRDTCAPPPQEKCKEMCKAGNVMACSAIGQALVRAGKYEEAYPLLKDASEKHERGAEMALAALYIAHHSPFEGKGDPDPLFGEACGLGSAPACEEVARMYEAGKNTKSALEFHTRACTGGVGAACVAAAKLDKANAKKLNQAACDLGLTEACPKPSAPKKKAP
jgi:TPR repeat protein